MGKKKIKKKNDVIRIEIMDTKPSGFYITDSDEIDAINLTPKDLKYHLKIEAGTDIENKLIRILLELDAYHISENEDEPKNNIYGIKSTSVFKCFDFEKVTDENGELNASDKFLRKLFNICIGGIRGMLATNLMSTNFSHLTVPLFDLTKMK